MLIRRLFAEIEQNQHRSTVDILPICSHPWKPLNVEAGSSAQTFLRAEMMRRSDGFEGLENVPFATPLSCENPS